MDAYSHLVINGLLTMLSKTMQQMRLRRQSRAAAGSRQSRAAASHGQQRAVTVRAAVGSQFKLAVRAAVSRGRQIQIGWATGRAGTLKGYFYCFHYSFVDLDVLGLIFVLLHFVAVVISFACELVAC
jgi:hypothetical protein